MTLPETKLHFQLTNDFIPTESIAVIFAAGIFDAVKKYETELTIRKVEDLQV